MTFDVSSELRELHTMILDLADRLTELEKRVESLEKNVQPRMATERQKAFINDICKTLNIPFPPGFPNKITFADASSFIDQKARFFYAARKEATTPKPKAEVPA